MTNAKVKGGLPPTLIENKNTLRPLRWRLLLSVSVPCSVNSSQQYKTSMYMPERAVGSLLSELTVFASNKYQLGQLLACPADMLAPHYNFVISWIIVLPLYIICFSLFIKLTALWHAVYFKLLTFYARRDRLFSLFVLPQIVIGNFGMHGTFYLRRRLLFANLILHSTLPWFNLWKLIVYN